MATDLEPFVGTVAVLAVLAGAVWLMLRSAAAHHILLPVAVGLGLRLVVMLVAHFGSVWAGDHGFMYRDDRGYEAMARVIAEHWRAGEIVNPAREDIAGTYIYGYPAFLGLIFTIAGTKMLLAKAINVVFSAATVLVGALLGERLLGRQALQRTAWLLALMPTLVWWAAPLMKEAACAFLFVACLLALTLFFRPWAIAGFAFAFLLLAMTRTTLSVAFGIAGVALVIVLAFKERGRPAIGRLAVVAVLMAGIPALSVVLQGQGQVGAVVNAYRSTANNEIDQYREASVGLGGHSVGQSVQDRRARGAQVPRGALPVGLRQGRRDLGPRAVSRDVGLVRALPHRGLRPLALAKTARALAARRDRAPLPRRQRTDLGLPVPAALERRAALRALRGGRARLVAPDAALGRVRPAGGRGRGGHPEPRRDRARGDRPRRRCRVAAVGARAPARPCPRSRWTSSDAGSAGTPRAKDSVRNGARR